MSVEVGHCRRIRLTANISGLHMAYVAAVLFQNTLISPPDVPLPVESLNQIRQRPERRPAGTFGTVRLAVRRKPACLIASLIIQILSVFDNYLTGRAREPRAGDGGVVRARIFLAGEMNRFH